MKLTAGARQFYNIQRDYLSKEKDFQKIEYNG